MNRTVFMARVAITVLACILAAAVALTAPPLWREALDMVFKWTLMLAGSVVVAFAVGDFVDGVKSDVARAIGRNAFKVARAAYKVARR